MLRRIALRARSRRYAVAQMPLTDRPSEFAYPAFQFDDGALLPGIEAFLTACAGYDAIVWVDMLLAPDDTLGGSSLLAVIQDHDDVALRRYIAQDATEAYV